jgi:hypothetical protein
MLLPSFLRDEKDSIDKTDTLLRIVMAPLLQDLLNPTPLADGLKP